MATSQHHKARHCRPQAHIVTGEPVPCPVQIASCFAFAIQLISTEGRLKHPFPNTCFSQLPLPSTPPKLLHLKCWDHFDLAFVTAVSRTAETEQTQKNWNLPHISVLIYLFVHLSHWLPSAELATWLHPQGPQLTQSAPFAWWKRAHSKVNQLTLQFVLDYSLRLSGRTYEVLMEEPRSVNVTFFAQHLAQTGYRQVLRYVFCRGSLFIIHLQILTWLEGAPTKLWQLKHQNEQQTVMEWSTLNI